MPCLAPRVLLHRIHFKSNFPSPGRWINDAPYKDRMLTRAVTDNSLSRRFLKKDLPQALTRGGKEFQV